MIEYWVMRIVPIEDVRAGAVLSREVQFINGDYVIPIDMETDQEAARGRAIAEHARTGIPHKVVMNADV